jgi:hypothetical protein
LPQGVEAFETVGSVATRRPCVLPYLGRLIFEQTRQFATQEFGAGEPLEKAKELCRRDGKAWSLDDFEGGVSGVTMLTVVADDNDRQAYTYRGRGASPGTAFQRRLPWQHFSKVFAYRALTEKRFHRQF